MTEPRAPIDRNLEELQRTLRALAQPFEVQVTLFPDFVVLGDELVMELGDALQACRHARVDFSELQEQCLRDLDEFIESVSGAPFLELWVERERMQTDARWLRMRSLAAEALDAFGWTNEVPSPSSATYVRGPQ